MEDEKKWLLKDLRIIRQSCLNRAVELAIACNLPEKNPTKQVLDTIKENADIFVHYIWLGLPNGLVTNEMTSEQNFEAKYKLNEPDIFNGMNEQQKSIFVKISDTYIEGKKIRVNLRKLKEEIIKLFGKLPTVAGSIPKVLNSVDIEKIKEQ